MCKRALRFGADDGYHLGTKSSTQLHRGRTQSAGDARYHQRFAGSEFRLHEQVGKVHAAGLHGYAHMPVGERNWFHLPQFEVAMVPVGVDLPRRARVEGARSAARPTQAAM